MDIVVYVIYDSLWENVVCVHNESNMECEVCKPIREERASEKSDWLLIEQPRKLQIKQHNDNYIHKGKRRV